MAMLKGFLLLFMIFFMGNAKGHLENKCPNGWTHFGCQCYKFFSESTNWNTAKRNCQSHGANLAQVSNRMENDFLLSLMPSSTRSWVGAHDSVQEGRWLWNDRTKLYYTNWCPGEPNNQHGSENCLEIRFPFTRCWNDAPCSYLMSYICVRGTKIF